MYKIIVVGESWNGSDCAGLARGLRDNGHAVELIGSDQFMPKTDGAIVYRATRKIIAPFIAASYNKYVQSRVSLLKPDIVLVYKGSYIDKKTIQDIRKQGIWLALYWPDVSMVSHESVNSAMFEYYDHIFTAKTFGIGDMARIIKSSQATFVAHGFDPYVHRPIISTASPLYESVDLSFIGTWSPHKQCVLSAMINKHQDNSLKIWGNQWDRNTNEGLKKYIMGGAVLGDYYALEICSSKINIALLSEKVHGSSSGDQVTARTFQIPACKGFMLHERTEEVLEYYVEGREIECFSGTDELIDKARFYLKNNELRRKVAAAGYERCCNYNSQYHRAKNILEK